MAWASRITLGAVVVLCSRREHSSCLIRALVWARVGGIRTPAAERRRVVVLLLAMAVLLLLDWLSCLGFGSSVDVVLLWRRAWYTSLRISPGRLR